MMLHMTFLDEILQLNKFSCVWQSENNLRKNVLRSARVSNITINFCS